MSVHVVSWVLQHSEESVPGRRLVLLVLADKADHDGTGAYPSVATIARETRMSERAVQYALKALRAAGRIEKLGTHPMYGTSEYQVHMLEGGAQSLHPGAMIDPGGVKQAAPEPSNSNHQASLTPRASTPVDEVPDGFPDELRPHARAVLPVLRRVAEHWNAKAPSVRALAEAMMARPRHPLVRCAHDYASWAYSQPSARHRDVVSAYRNWLDRAGELAGTERLPGEGPPVLPGNVTRLGTSTAAERRREEANYNTRYLMELGGLSYDGRVPDVKEAQ